MTVPPNTLNFGKIPVEDNKSFDMITMVAFPSYIGIQIEAAW